MAWSDDPPAIDRLSIEDSVTVHYQSERSGNEVDRSGQVTETTRTDRGELYWVHTGQRGALKHQYVTLMQLQTQGRGDVVLAQSVTVSADPPNDGDPPAPGAAFTVRFTVERTSFLGVVDRVMRRGININVVDEGTQVQ
jgi:hypothetical protein